MTPHDTDGPPNRAEHPQAPAEGDRDEVESALDRAEGENGREDRPPSEESASDADAGDV